MTDNPEHPKPSVRVDPVDEVQRILRVYSGPARNGFRMHLERLLADPDYLPTGGAGSVEHCIRKIHRMLRGHPQLEEKREAIRQLLGLPAPASYTST
jgi:hypothetical protein